jgi:hypothetical protein
LIANSLLAQNGGYGINEVDSATNSMPRFNDFFENGAGLLRRNAGSSLSLEQINQLAGAAGNLAGDPLFEVVAQGTIDAVVYDVASGRSLLTDTGAAFGDLSGLVVNPDLAQKRRFYIYSNTGTSMLIEGDVTAIADVGDAFDVVADVPMAAASPLVNAGEYSFDLPATDHRGNARWIGTAVDIGAYELDITVSVDERVAVSDVELEQNTPNPGLAQTEIRFRLPARDMVRLEIFDRRGRRVAELLSGERDAGMHRVSFNAGALAAGVYFYRLEAGAQVLQRKMMVLP